MENLKAQFIISNTTVEKCPPPDKPEYAFIGRSNVGKSSLINMLAGHKKLAKTSGRPGKTQLINHFLFEEHWYLVDLPGYGYAKVSKAKKADWGIMIENYLQQRNNLLCVFVLIDVRLDPQEADMEFMHWLGEKQLPFVMVFTKGDKLSPPKRDKSIAFYKKEMLKSWEFMPQYFVTSAVQNKGRDELLNFIHEINKEFKKIA